MGLGLIVVEGNMGCQVLVPVHELYAGTKSLQPVQQCLTGRPTPQPPLQAHDAVPNVQQHLGLRAQWLFLS